MRHKVAIFVDWDNLRNDIDLAKRNAKKREEAYWKNIDYNDKNHISYFLRSFLDKDEDIYRIFFYTAKPLTHSDIKHLPEDIQNTFQEHPRIKEINKFLDEIAQQDFFALRLGRLIYKGVDSKNKQIHKQKLVDMLVGLDIAHVAYQKLVDRILVFSKDTDMIPALKCARNCGVQVKIANLKCGIGFNRDLRKHSDIVITKSLEEIKPPVTSY